VLRPTAVLTVLLPVSLRGQSRKRYAAAHSKGGCGWQICQFAIHLAAFSRELWHFSRLFSHIYLCRNHFFTYLRHFSNIMVLLKSANFSASDGLYKTNFWNQKLFWGLVVKCQNSRIPWIPWFWYSPRHIKCIISCEAVFHMYRYVFLRQWLFVACKQPRAVKWWSEYSATHIQGHITVNIFLIHKYCM